MHHLCFQLLRPRQQQLGSQSHSWLVDLKMKNVHSYVSLFTFRQIDCNITVFSSVYTISNLGYCGNAFWYNPYIEACQEEYLVFLAMHHLQMLCPQQQQLGFQ